MPSQFQEEQMEKKTKKMAALELTIVELEKKRGAISDKCAALDSYKPESGPAEKLRKDTMSQLSGERDSVGNDINNFRMQLEVATVEMLAGFDADFAEPTPADILRNAS